MSRWRKLFRLIYLIIVKFRMESIVLCNYWFLFCRLVLVQVIQWIRLNVTSTISIINIFFFFIQLFTKFDVNKEYFFYHLENVWMTTVRNVFYLFYFVLFLNWNFELEFLSNGDYDKSVGLREELRTLASHIFFSRLLLLFFFFCENSHVVCAYEVGFDHRIVSHFCT